MSMLQADAPQTSRAVSGSVHRWDLWDRKVAAAIARDEEVPELTERHWDVIEFLRGYYRAFGSAPSIELVRKELRLPFRQVYELFPTGLRRGAWRIAGLPQAPLAERRTAGAARRGQRRAGRSARL